jgi:hypothetical protein
MPGTVTEQGRSAWQTVTDYARAQVGDPYGWGAEGPDAFDCSGLVYAAYKAAGLPVKDFFGGRTTAAVMGTKGKAVSLADAKPADVLYFDNPGPTDHVALVSDRPGYMIEAPYEGQPVREVPIRTPTSVRHFTGGAVAGTDENTISGWEDLANPLTLLANWQTDTVAIGLKILGGVAAAALVVVGAREALQKG